MKLAKALKVKNELVAKLKQAYLQLAKENSVSVNAVRAYEPKEVMTNIENLTGQLIDLKTKIAVANTSVMPLIIKMGEHKNACSLLRGIDCTNGEMEQDRFSRSSGPVMKKVVFSQVEVDQKIEAHEKTISSIQEQLDTHNYNTDIEFVL